MAIYNLPEPWSSPHRQRLRKARGWAAGTLALVSVIAFYLWVNSVGRSAEVYRVLTIGTFVTLVNFWKPFGKRNVYQKTVASLRMNSIEIDSEGLKINWMNGSRFVPWKQIARVEEPPNGRGMYVRTPRRFSWLVIPRRTEHYEAIRGELSAIGIPILQTAAPWNWGILFVALFCASLLCNLLTQNRLVLGINLGVALIVGVVGAVSVNLWTLDRSLRVRSIVGSFVPATISVVSLIFPFGIK